MAEKNEIPANKSTLIQYIATNLYRMGNMPGTNQTSLILMMSAASILSAGDDPQTIAAARRLAQLAISTQKRK